MNLRLLFIMGQGVYKNEMNTKKKQTQKIGIFFLVKTFE
jgi:hypothetical protein